MPYKNIIGVVSKFADQADKSIRHFRKKPGEKALHDLRVVLKKIEALRALTVAVAGFDVSLPRYKKWRKFFRKTGRIRDQQVMGAWLQENGYSAWAHAICPPADLERQMDAFRKQSRKYRLLVRKQTRKMAAKVKLLRRGEMETALQCRYQTLWVALVSASKSKDNWHQLRRDIKQSLFLHSLFPDTWNKAHPSWHPFKQLDLLQISLGNWHDLTVLGDMVNLFIVDKKQKSKEKKQLSDLTHTINTYRLQEENRLISLLTAILE